MLYSRIALYVIWFQIYTNVMVNTDHELDVICSSFSVLRPQIAKAILTIGDVEFNTYTSIIVR
jgi:hypothetical protein